MTDIEWGPAIAVDGKRPGWLQDWQPIRGTYNHGRYPWIGDDTYLAKQFHWEHVASIRLPADHPHYRQTEAVIPEGMKPWHGGDAAPADWDSEKPIAVIDDGKVSIRYGHRWDWSREPVTAYGHKLLRVVAYTPQPTPQADTKPDLTEVAGREAVALLRRMLKWDGSFGDAGDAAAANGIVALLSEPVDSDLIEAREVVAVTLDDGDWAGVFKEKVRAGDQDDGDFVRVARAAIARGRALALAGEKEA
ncbi:hypothetical protein [Sphingomonas abaci]|uniref:Uncharacterized protein n=1 Tax=Sphingomonas abaci TaxID=237611 RepID=A0A7W7AH66_9SPHN|nr:hypothetical protein [Sphingomonas abaci]MBB4616930.1 hypothetical protein [Sphingomonas abaci]